MPTLNWLTRDGDTFDPDLKRKLPERKALDGLTDPPGSDCQSPWRREPYRFHRASRGVGHAGGPAYASGARRADAFDPLPVSEDS